MIALLLLACEPETVREGSPEDVDLSGYATLEDLAALQATVDEQASRIEALEAQIPTVSTASCEAGNSLFYFESSVQVLYAEICWDTREEAGYLRCTTDQGSYGQSVPLTSRDLDEPTNGVKMSVTVDCGGGGDIVRLVTVPSAAQE